MNRITIGNSHDVLYGWMCNHSYYGLMIDGIYYDTVNHYLWSQITTDSTIKKRIEQAETGWLAYSLYKRFIMNKKFHDHSKSIHNKMNQTTPTDIKTVYTILYKAIKAKLEHTPHLIQKLKDTLDTPIESLYNNIIDVFTCQIYMDIRLSYHAPKIQNNPIQDLKESNLTNIQLSIVHEFTRLCIRMIKLEGYKVVYYEMLPDVVYNFIRDTKTRDRIYRFCQPEKIQEYMKFNNVSNVCNNISSHLLKLQTQSKYIFEKITPTAEYITLLLVWCELHEECVSQFLHTIRKDKIIFPPHPHKYRQQLPTKKLTPLSIPSQLTINYHGDEVYVTGLDIHKYKIQLTNLGGRLDNNKFIFPILDASAISDFVFTTLNTRDKSIFIQKLWCSSVLSHMTNSYTRIKEFVKNKTSNQIFDWIMTNLYNLPNPQIHGVQKFISQNEMGITIDIHPNRIYKFLYVMHTYITQNPIKYKTATDYINSVCFNNSNDVDKSNYINIILKLIKMCKGGDIKDCVSCVEKLLLDRISPIIHNTENIPKTPELISSPTELIELQTSDTSEINDQNKNKTSEFEYQSLVNRYDLADNITSEHHTIIRNLVRDVQHKDIIMFRNIDG